MPGDRVRQCVTSCSSEVKGARMSRVVARFVVGAMLIGLLAGCSSGGQKPPKTERPELT